MLVCQVNFEAVRIQQQRATLIECNRDYRMVSLSIATCQSLQIITRLKFQNLPPSQDDIRKLYVEFRQNFSAVQMDQLRRHVYVHKHLQFHTQNLVTSLMCLQVVRCKFR